MPNSCKVLPGTEIVCVAENDADAAAMGRPSGSGADLVGAVGWSTHAVINRMDASASFRNRGWRGIKVLAGVGKRTFGE
ncbi:MAG TPA: hypothetical protein VF710_15080 [Longimicrobium sp.]